MYFIQVPIPVALAARFPKRIRERGAEYERSGMVELRQASASRVEAQVSGTDVYHVSVVRDAHGDFQLFCTCPDAEGDVHCKHVWATLLEADATVGLPSVPADAAGPTELPAHPPPATPASRGSWQAQLRGVRAAFDPTRPPAAPAAWPEGRRIVYIVDATPLSHGFDGVALDVATQALLPDGTWGTLKQMRQSRGQWLAAPDPEDRLIAQMLVGTRPEYSAAAAPTAASRYTIPADALTTTLQRACLTGRGRVRSVPRDLDPPVLRWDAGDEYDLRLVVAREDDGRFALHGVLVREAARIDVRDCTLITAGGIAIVANMVVRYRDQGAFPLVRALRTHLARAYAAKGNLAMAAEYVTIETAGDDPQLLLMVAEAQIRAGRTARWR